MTCRFNGSNVEIEVSDRGPDLVQSEGIDTGVGLGLLGLHERIECVGGTLEISSPSGAHSTLGPHFAPSLTAKVFNFIRLELL